MRTLSATLLAAQKKPSAVPYVKVEAVNKIAGVVRYDWSRLYTGAEDDYYHALTMPGDGSLIRVRLTPPADSRKLYRQRVASPGPGSNFSSWVYTSQYNVVAVAAAALGAEVSIFFIKSDRSINQMQSTDYGATWGSPSIIAYTPTTSINGLSAAYKTGGDIALFYADTATLYVIKRVSGSWGSAIAWDKTTGDLSGVACAYSGDWNLLVTGKDAADNFKLWSLVYGNGSDVAAGAWSSLKEIATAPAGGQFEYRCPFLDKPDVYRCFFVEKFTGTEAYNRPFWSHSVLDARFIDNRWREPVPFNFTSVYGLAIAHYGDYGWLSSAAGVWRANLTSQSLSLTADILSLQEELEEGSGKLTVELRNDTGQYASPGTGSLAILNIGGHIEFSPGYRSTAGSKEPHSKLWGIMGKGAPPQGTDEAAFLPPASWGVSSGDFYEASPGLSFFMDAYEHTSAGGKASLLLYARDGWSALNNWHARYQFRWNKASSELSVKDILQFILARVGLKLQVVSESSVLTGTYPDFTISPGDSGGAVMRRLLSFVPDVLFIEGYKVYVLNPQSSDISIYSYGVEHKIYEGRYRLGAWALNRVQVEGRDSGTGDPIIANSFTWDEIGRVYERLEHVEDRNISSVSQAQNRGQAYLRQAEIKAAEGYILVPVNCGQQLYDVIDITDSRAGLTAKKKRVLGIAVSYQPKRGEYNQILRLGNV